MVEEKGDSGIGEKLREKWGVYREGWWKTGNVVEKEGRAGKGL